MNASSAEVGLLNTAQFLAWPLVGLFAGVWVDRLSRRRILVVSDAARAVVLASIPAACVLGHLTLPQLLVAAAVAGAFTVFFDLAATAHVPALLPRQDWADGNAKLEGVQQAVAAGAPGLAGVLITAVSAPFAVVADALSFVGSAVLIGATKAGSAASSQPRRPLVAEAAEGIRVILRDRALSRVVVCAAISNAGLMMGVAVQLLFLYRVMHLSAVVVGVCYALGSLASVVGALYNQRVMRRLGVARTLILSTFVEGLSFILVPAGLWLPIVPLLLGALLLSGFFNTTWNVSVTTFRQTRIPLDLLGRVGAAGRVIGYGALPLGSLLGGLLGQVLSMQLGTRLGLALALAAGSLVAASSAVALLRVGTSFDVNSRHDLPLERGVHRLARGDSFDHAI